MQSSHIYRHPEIVKVIYVIMLFGLPILFFMRLKGSLLLAAIILCLLIFCTYIMIREIQYKAIYSHNRAKKYLMIDMGCVFIGMVLYYIGLYLFLQTGVWHNTLLWCMIFLFAYLILLRDEELARYAEAIEDNNQPTQQLSTVLEKLRDIPTMWIVHASTYDQNIKNYFVYFELYEKGNFYLRFKDGNVTLKYVYKGLSGDDEISVGYIVEDYLNNKPGDSKNFTYKTVEEAIDVLRNYGGIIEKILAEQKFYKIFKHMKKKEKRRVIISKVLVFLFLLGLLGMPIIFAALEKEPPMKSTSEEGIQFDVPSTWTRTGLDNWISYSSESAENFDNTMEISIDKFSPSKTKEMKAALDKEIKDIYDGKALYECIVYSDVVKEKITVDGIPATMYSYYLVDESEAKDPSSIEYCMNVLIEHDNRIYNLFFREIKNVGDINWPDWIERLVPRISTEGRLGIREQEIVASIEFE